MTNEQSLLGGLVSHDGLDDDSGAAGEVVREVGVEAADPPSKTCLRLDRWGLLQGESVRGDNPRLKEATRDDHEAADFHGLAFEPSPELADRVEDLRRREFLDSLLGTAEFQALHRQTQLDAFASELAACAFAEQYAALRKADEAAAAQPPGRPGNRLKNPADPGIRNLQAVAKALKAAGKDVEEAREAAAAAGLGEGGNGSVDPRRVAAAYKRVRNSPNLRAICERAGRYRRLAAARQRQKTLHGQDEVVGVTLGDEVEHLLASELAVLADDGPLGDDALARFAERRLMQTERSGVEPVGRGPIVVVLDESSSMAGDKIHAAKALVLALVWLAARQRRWVGLVAFSGGKEGRWLTMPPGRKDEAPLFAWLEAFIGSGTELDVPLKELPEKYWGEMGAPPGKTDVIIITDAEVRAKPAMVASFNAWKKQAQARVLSIIVDGEPGDLSLVSDEVHTVRSLDVGEEAVGRAVSI